MASSNSDKPEKPGLWAILTCKVCQTVETGDNHFTEIDDSVHRILKDEHKGATKSEKALRLEEINRKAKEEQEKQKEEIAAKEAKEREEEADTETGTGAESARSS